VARGQADKAAKVSNLNLWSTSIGLVVAAIGIAVAVYAGGLQLIAIFQSTMDSKSKSSEEVNGARLEAIRKELEQMKEELKLLRQPAEKPVTPVAQKPPVATQR
jgi:Tfp pilus assembly protein PilO